MKRGVLLCLAALAIGVPGTLPLYASSHERGTIRAFVSIEPQAYLVERICGDSADVRVLVDAGQDPHTYEPTPAQMSALARSDVYAADQLFATLDPTLRKLDSLSSGPAIIADTVGFVRDLPHDLVAAFRSTLAEVRDADLLLHVVDAADIERDVRIEQVNAVLADIGAADVPQLLVFNKLDALPEAQQTEQVQDVYELDGRPIPRVFVSARSGSGLAALRGLLAQAVLPAVPAADALD